MGQLAQDPKSHHARSSLNGVSGSEGIVDLFAIDSAARDADEGRFEGAQIILRFIEKLEFDCKFLVL